jgi:hypothetical protein
MSGPENWDDDSDKENWDVDTSDKENGGSTMSTKENCGSTMPIKETGGSVITTKETDGSVITTKETDGSISDKIIQSERILKEQFKKQKKLLRTLPGWKRQSTESKINTLKNQIRQIVLDKGKRKERSVHLFYLEKCTVDGTTGIRCPHDRECSKSHKGTTTAGSKLHQLIQAHNKRLKTRDDYSGDVFTQNIASICRFQSSASNGGLTRDDWKEIETVHVPWIMAVLKALVDYGGHIARSSVKTNSKKKKDKKKKGSNQKDQDVKSSSQNVAGKEKYDSFIRPEIRLILGLKKVKNNKKNPVKNNKKGRNTVKETAMANTLENKIKEDLATMKRGQKRQSSTTVFSSLKTIECRLMQICLRVQSMILARCSTRIFYNCILALHSVIRDAEEGGVTLQALEDAKMVLSNHDSNFDLQILFKEYPDLLFSNMYTKVYKTKIAKPNKMQKRMVEHLHRNRESKPSICLVSTTPGSGKTTGVMALVAYLSEERKISEYSLKKSDKKPRVLVFVCANSRVLSQVGRDAFNAGIPLAMAVNGRITKNNNAAARENVMLVISDLETATSALTYCNSDKVMVLDEPTIAAEKDNPINDMVGELLAILPKTTFLLSATLPTEIELKPIIDHFEKRHGSPHVEWIPGESMPISSRLICDGKVQLPWTLPDTSDDINMIVDRLKRVLMRKRYLTIEVFLTLHSRMKAAGMKIRSMNELFPDKSKVGHVEIADGAIKSIEQLFDSKINFKSILNPMADTHCMPIFDLTKMLTSHAHHYVNGCLYVSKDPLNAARIAGLKLTKVVEKERERLVKKYYIDFVAYEKKKASIAKEKDKEMRQEMEQGLVKPSFRFNPSLQINTLEHVAEHKGKVDSYQKSIDYFSLINSEDIMTSSQIQVLTLKTQLDDLTDEEKTHGSDQWLFDLLLIGVGVYDPVNLPKVYTDLVMQMCINGKISFLFASRSIVYGTNLPLSTVVVEKSFSEECSLNTLDQLSCRAGRSGLSPSATMVFTDQKQADRIKSDEKNVEAINLCNALRKIIGVDVADVDDDDVDDYDDVDHADDADDEGNADHEGNNRGDADHEGNNRGDNGDDVKKSVYVPPHKTKKGEALIGTSYPEDQKRQTYITPNEEYDENVINLAKVTKRLVQKQNVLDAKILTGQKIYESNVFTPISNEPVNPRHSPIQSTSKTWNHMSRSPLAWRKDMIILSKDPNDQ